MKAINGFLRCFQSQEYYGNRLIEPIGRLREQEGGLLTAKRVNAQYEQGDYDLMITRAE